jgi:hypothetical protein
MRRCQNVTAWTDYPFAQLGDIPHQKASIRHVRVVAYDGDKYAQVVVDGQREAFEVKGCYLYRKPGRLGEVRQLNRRKLERMEPTK